MQKKQNRKNRTQGGQAILEGTAMLCVITMISVLLIMLGVNVYSIMLHDFKLQLIAYEAARADTESHYWLGMKRTDKSDPGYSPDHSKAAAIAEELAAIAGVKIKAVEFSTPDNFKGSVCTITSGFQLPFGTGVFEAFKAMNRSTQAAATASVQAPPMLVQLNSKFFPKFTNPNSSVTRNASVFIPCYGANTASGTAVVNDTFSTVSMTSSGPQEPIGVGIPCPSPALASDIRKSVGIMEVGTMNGSGSNGDGGFAPIAGDAPVQQASTVSSKPGPDGRFIAPNTAAYGTLGQFH